MDQYTRLEQFVQKFIFWPSSRVGHWVTKFECVRVTLSFLGGFILGQGYYHCFLKEIPYVSESGWEFSIVLSLLLGLGNVFVVQIRCVSLLLFPMYCGKPGRGVLKALLLSYVVAGPITNMGLNAQEVVRVFACSAHLPYNISKAKYTLLVGPMKTALLGLKSEINEVKDTLWSITEILSPIEKEMEGTKELEHLRHRADMIDEQFGDYRRSWQLEEKFKMYSYDKDSTFFQKSYSKKVEYRCEDVISRGMEVCSGIFWETYEKCSQAIPAVVTNFACSPVDPVSVCGFLRKLGDVICDTRKQINPGLGQGYSYLEKAKYAFVDNDLKLRYQVVIVHEVYNIQDAKETGAMVIHAFEEKRLIMSHVITILYICVALLFLRIACAAITYHDLYLINIEYDNIYITDYFKKIDLKRHLKGKCSLLPLKKMERRKYVDVNCPKYRVTDRNELLVHLLKVMLEVVTATTFVMLDRLFYEALDVVRQHAEFDGSKVETANLDIEIIGNGFIANVVRRFLTSLKTQGHSSLPMSKERCLPHPRPMPPLYYLKIYGGYLWIILLLASNSYTSRLKRLICSHFYPRREKQRILHLYNDILKNRLKLDKTLRRRAIRAVRAHYLSGETLLSARLRFPKLLGWLEFLPTARMKCTICGETQPRNMGPDWHRCATPSCGFVWCGECWRETGACLACDATLVDLSDIESLSDDDLPKY